MTRRACVREMTRAARSEYTGADDYHEALEGAAALLGEREEAS